MSDRINSVDVVFSSGELVVVTPPVYRGDSGQILTVSGIPFDVETMRVAFAADDDGVAIPQTGTITDSVLTVPIPNEILAAAFRKIRAYFAVIDTDSVTTVYQVIFPVAGAPEIVDVYEEASEAQRTAVDNIILAMESGEVSAGAAPDIRSDRINSVDVVFAPGEAVVVTPPVYCGDSGQVLTVSGIPFDVGAMRVAFAADDDGVAIPQIGVIAENVLTVTIPNEILAVAHKKIRAYFAVVDTNSITTVYQVIMPVAGAPEITDIYEEASEA